MTGGLKREEKKQENPILPLVETSKGFYYSLSKELWLAYFDKWMRLKETF